MRLKAEGLPMTGAGGIPGMMIRDGIHPDGEDRVIILRGTVPVRLTGIIQGRPTGVIRVHLKEVTPVQAAEEVPVLPEVIPAHPTGVIPAHRAGAIPAHREKATPVLPAVAVLLVAIPARSAMPAGSSPAVAAGRAMPAIPPAVAVAVQVKDNLVI